MLQCSHHFLHFIVRAHFLRFLLITLSPKPASYCSGDLWSFSRSPKISTHLFVLVANQTFPSSGYLKKKIDSEKGLKIQAVCLEGDPRKHSGEGGERERRQEKGTFMNGFLLWASRAQACRGRSVQSC